MASILGYTTEVVLENLLLVDIDSSFSTQIDSWISTAEERVDKYLGYTTASGLWAEAVSGELNDARIDGDLNLVIHPRKRPITSVSSLQIWKGSDSVTLSLTDGATNRYTIPVQADVIIYPGHELSVSASSYALNSLAQLKYSRFYTKLDYIAGYTSIPRPIQHATTLMTADIFMRQANKEGLVSITQGRVTKRWAERKDGRSDFIIDAEEILNPYKIASGWF